ncbi:iron transporter [Echinicola pacifica]|uniref:Iron transporter n=1 Tax=Echinicola pacifica TaxID=346377 RepID=A0A918UHR1_9BACT|nr:PepSY-associated TM helix domain-containing protein [Echinicola pacifica]GGZ12913.1 iron transporter [Echinicola pacifica]
MKKQKTNWQKTRKFFNDIHLWLGLAGALILIPVCLSGTIYVYYSELKDLSRSEQVWNEGPQDAKPLAMENLIVQVKSQAEGDISSVTIPKDKSKNYQFSVKKEGDRSRFGTTYYVNPYTGAIAGNSETTTAMDGFMRSMFSLHRWLLLDTVETEIIAGLENRKLGSYITGTATILFTIGVMTGLIIWFPQRLKSWKQGLKLKLNGSWKRANHDLHNTLGFYAFFFLLIMGLTGPQWSFPWYRTGLQKALGVYQEREAGGGDRGPSQGGRPEGGSNQKAKEVASPEFLPFTDYLSAVDAELPYEGDYRVSFPKDGKGNIEIQKSKVGFFAPYGSDEASLKVENAAIVELSKFSDQDFNQQIARSIKALHIGTVYGGITKLIYFISCLIATSLPITGTIIWINKMKKKGKRKNPKRKEELQYA